MMRHEKQAIMGGMTYILVSLTIRRNAMATWQVQEAKTRFSELLERARREGPQTITKHGKPRAIVLSVDEFEAMARSARPGRNFKDFLLNEGPKFDEFEIERDEDTGRDITLE
jgi:antitoxin Phd